MYERLAVCMWASVSMRRAALCAASVSSWGGTVRNARVLHAACRFAKTARLRATSFAWGLRRPAICGGLSWSRRRLLWAAPAGRCAGCAAGSSGSCRSRSVVTLANVMVVLMFCALSWLACSSAAAAAACWAACSVCLVRCYRRWLGELG